MVKTGDKAIIIGEDTTIWTVTDAALQTRDRVVLTHPEGWSTRRAISSVRKLSGPELSIIAAANRMISGRA